MLNQIISKIPVPDRWKIVLKTLPFTAIILGIKSAIHYLGWEFLDLNSLFTAIISANIFLISFLISGVLADYKESEKLPGDLSACLETMADEALIIFEAKKSPEAKAFLKNLIDFNQGLIEWFYKKRLTDDLRRELVGFNHFFLAFEKLAQPSFIVRLKQEQHQIRRILKRINTIRETSFLGTGYAIVEVITFILSLGLIFVDFKPFYESAFFVGFITFILIYMIFFIKDLDNPFGYTQEENMVEEVSLQPIFDSKRRLQEYYNELD